MSEDREAHSHHHDHDDGAHHHDHHHDGDDGHHHHHAHSEAEEFVAGTSALVFTHEFAFAKPIDRVELERRIRLMMQELSEQASIEGVVLGHLKGFVKAGDRTFAFSSTRAGVVDEIPGKGWEGLDRIDAFSLVLDLITLQPLEIDETMLYARLEGR